MQASGRRNKPCRTSLAALITLAGVICPPATAAGRAAGARPASPRQYERADAQTIRSEAREILKHSRFKQTETLWQRFKRWLWEKLGNWRLPGSPLGRGVVAVLFWGLVGLCILAIAAVLALLIWTIIFTARDRQGGRRGRKGAVPQFSREDLASYEELRARMAQLAGQGAFREAIGLMIRALLRYLERAGTVRFDQSKTNGDYVREYSPARPGRDEFRRFVLAFDNTIYGRAASGPDDYRQMLTMFERVCGHVRSEP